MLEKFLEIFATPTVTWQQIVITLTVSGAVGGFGYHLVLHKGALDLPQRTTDTPRKMLCGFLSDVFIGIIAANSINIALSGIIDYSKGSWHDAKLTTTLISLGILAGFSGGPVLQALSKKVLDTLGAKVDELSKDQAELGKGQRVLEQKTDTLLSRATEHIVNDTLQYRRDPSPVDKKLIEVQSADLGAKPEGERKAHDWLVLAYHASEQDRYSDAVSYLLKAIRLGLSREWLWTAYNLLGICYHYEGATGWQANSENAYKSALEYSIFQEQKAVSTVNLGYVYLDTQNYPQAYDTASQALVIPLVEEGRFVQIKYVALLLRAAAAIKLQKYDEASASLKNITSPTTVEYLFRDKSISAEMTHELANLPDLTPEWRAMVTKYL